MPLSFLSFRKRTSGTTNSKRRQSSGLPEELCRRFSVAEIQKATNNFNKDLILGEGGFGSVYKGYIDDGAMAVAIKRLSTKSSQGATEFQVEVLLLCQLRHPHLASLIGFCHDEGEMILVYKYISKGTFRDHLYGANNDLLPWKKRLEICIGAASGLHYLHSGVKRAIVHRNIKTTNIMLDDNWEAKISDFGLSKVGPLSMSNALIRMDSEVKGTFGYLDPEYYRTQQLTDKSDVYSFGMVLFEVLCARKPLNPILEEEQVNLAIWAQKCIKQGTLYHIIDPYLKGKIAPECFKKFVEIAHSCVSDRGVERPTMGEVEASLEFALELQGNADAAIQGNNPGAEYYYPEVIFSAITITITTDDGAPLDDHVQSDGSELSYPSVDTSTGVATPSVDTNAEPRTPSIPKGNISGLNFSKRFLLLVKKR